MTSNHIGFGSEPGTIGGPNIRIVMIEQNQILLYRHQSEDYWVFPGGGPLFGETTKDAIKRIIKKRGGFEIEVPRLLWIMENFFVWKSKRDTLDGRKIHGIGFFYLVTPKEPEGSWQQEEFRSIDSPELIFKWFKLDELSHVDLKPEALKQLLKKIPNNPVHVVCRTE